MIDVDNVWIRGMGDALIRADSIVVLTQAHDGLRAECVSGRMVRLTEGGGPTNLQLSLLQEMRQASADERWAIVIMPVSAHGTVTWSRERVDTLIDRA
jgi:hypothetical protein